MAWVSIALAIAKEVAANAPELIQVINIIREAIEQKRTPTAEEWKVLDSIADQNNLSINQIAADHGITIPSAASE